jgi:hypothetical protein
MGGKSFIVLVPGFQHFLMRLFSVAEFEQKINAPISGACVLKLFYGCNKLCNSHFLVAWTNTLKNVFIILPVLPNLRPLPQN